MTPKPASALEMKLARYAAGAVSPGLRLLIETHLENCAANTARVEAYEALGGEMLRSCEKAELREGALDSVLARLDGEAPTEPTEPTEPKPSRPIESRPLPESLMASLSMDYSEIRWQPRLPGLSEYVIDGFGDEQVSLLRARPGAWMPKHTHEGEETTLILTGAMEDGGTVLGPGEIVLNDETVDHQPRIVGDEVCHCLVVMTGRMRFTGTISRALNYLGE